MCAVIRVLCCMRSCVCCVSYEPTCVLSYVCYVWSCVCCVLYESTCVLSYVCYAWSCVCCVSYESTCVVIRVFCHTCCMWRYMRSLRRMCWCMCHQWVIIRVLFVICVNMCAAIRVLCVPVRVNMCLLHHICQHTCALSYMSPYVPTYVCSVSCMSPYVSMCVLCVIYIPICAVIRVLCAICHHMYPHTCCHTCSLCHMSSYVSPNVPSSVSSVSYVFICIPTRAVTRVLFVICHHVPPHVLSCVSLCCMSSYVSPHVPSCVSSVP